MGAPPTFYPAPVIKSAGEPNFSDRGPYHTPVAGLTHVNPADHSFSAYRFHEEDPVFYRTGLRLTCRCEETVDGRASGDPRETTYTTYARVYQW